MSHHETYIKRCLEIAKNGLGSTRPNPMVGSVVVHNNIIISEGYTSAYGGNHAEVNAIKNAKDKSLLKEATIYVTLEPCAHFGKTPPCSDLIIKHQIPNVVIGCMDDNLQVAGKGIEKLKNAGCNVIVGVLENECKKHHKRFFTFHNKKRPYIILKWAESSDGFIAPESKNERKPVWITNVFSRQLVHKWRTEEQAILVGTNTVLQDNPSLTARDWTGENPVRVVIDKTHKLSNNNYSIFNDAAETITISQNNIDFSKHLAQQICEVLFKKNINSVIIEGGAKTLQTFIDENLWDEARVFTGSIKFEKGIKAPKFSGQLISEKNIMTDYLKTYTND
ncbi:bifunctional diaminohydroxyphosphoribosylaminopyrimidine deaminase/5-amino-6-(5-phosphoribosylamino)uracil reductase RibD [Thalassobellus suaedae]|uniref:Riboflavin biosynthesis protein RibD n=1 Tax=Thalassobellus suaedae TaxID=3074124 RepID=A0ABY9Y159_9FLAO|nr:bifunctional diaminohydroxyphosphoribosylaminopyrimidine deaminase/5-amino-6-(5-phosphoribosylamino)uracil reductase RibD [Flavobacteriaceae bacterium HL-DH10]